MNFQTIFNTWKPKSSGNEELWFIPFVPELSGLPVNHELYPESLGRIKLNFFIRSEVMNSQGESRYLEYFSVTFDEQPVMLCAREKTELGFSILFRASVCFRLYKSMFAYMRDDLLKDYIAVNPEHSHLEVETTVTYPPESTPEFLLKPGNYNLTEHFESMNISTSSH